MPTSNAKSKFSGPDRTARSRPRHARARATQREFDSKHSRTTRSIFVTLGANIAIALAKGAGAFFSGSGALLAEAMHSLADTGNSALLLWGRREAKKPPSPDHPMGYGRATYFWSFVVALLLFTAGGIASIYEGVPKLRAGFPLQSRW